MNDIFLSPIFFECNEFFENIQRNKCKIFGEFTIPYLQAHCIKMFKNLSTAIISHMAWEWRNAPPGHSFEFLLLLLKKHNIILLFYVVIGGVALSSLSWERMKVLGGEGSGHHCHSPLGHSLHAQFIETLGMLIAGTSGAQLLAGQIYAVTFQTRIIEANWHHFNTMESGMFSN